MSQPDLFVVCKNCGSEVSPYVTECPYCGQRVRKRAPKLDRGGPDEEERPRRRGRRSATRLPRLRPDEIEGIAPDVRPWATMAIVAASVALTVVLAGSSSINVLDVGAVLLGIEDDAWRYFAAPFVHDNLGHQFVALGAAAIFGSLLERRMGFVAPIAVFVLAGAAGAAAAVAVDFDGPYDERFVFGANGAALGLLAAWLVDDRLAARRGVDRENDLLGVYVIGAVLLLLSLAVAEANVVAGLAGGVAGALLGLVLRPFARG